MIDLILGNLFGLLAMIADSFSSSMKTTKKVLWVQSLAQVFYCAGSVVLKGYSAAAQSVVSILRNFTVLGKKHPKWLEWLWVVLGVALGICCNNRGFWGFLPIIANLEYSIAIIAFKKNERALKFAFLVSIPFYAVFSAVILNFVSLVCNIVIFISTAVFLIKDSQRHVQAQ